MKKLLILIPLLAFGQIAPEKAADWTHFIAGTAATSFSINSTATFLIFENGIQINCRTGEVKIPNDMTLTEASLSFWRQVAKAWPEARQAIIEGEKKTP